MDELETAEKLAQIIETGKQASELLHNSTFVELVDELLALYSTQTFLTAPDDKALREQFYQQHVAVQSLRDILTTRMLEGQDAEALLNELEKESK